MTPDEHTAQRDRVAASLRADDARESHRGVYAVRERETDRGAVQTRRFAPFDPRWMQNGQWLAWCATEQDARDYYARACRRAR